ncbi:hypothetical protein H0H92_006327 [Tricholoma furcatifolium]|nr:hypothetical protein H0H92_006327 [Tricholoma furcatifolium]
MASHAWPANAHQYYSMSRLGREYQSSGLQPSRYRTSEIIRCQLNYDSSRLDATWLYGLPGYRGIKHIAMSQHLLPLEVSSSTGEPFLRLPHPRDNIILTPPRLHDVDAIIMALNNPKVYNWMPGLPFPYQPEHGLAWLSEQMEEAEKVLRRLEQPAYIAEQSKFVLGSPVRIIRETKEDGTDNFLGYAGIYRSERKELLDEKERKAALAADAQKKAGDPTIVWDIAGEVVARVGPYQHVEHRIQAMLSRNDMVKAL